MIAFHRSAGAMVVAFSVFASVSGPAAAAKKMSYEQAYEKCKEELAGKLQAETANSGSRYTVAGGCMKKYGYRLKK